MTYRIGWKQVFIIALSVVVGYLVSERAGATEWNPKITPPHQTQAQTTHAGDSQATAQAVSDVGGVSAVGSVDNSTRFLALSGVTDPGSPSIGPGCPLWVPGDGKERNWNVLGVAVSAVLEKDDACWTEFIADKNHDRTIEFAYLELERERVQLERERIAAESLKLRTCESAARREEVLTDLCK